MPHVVVENVSVKFRVYHDHSPSIKDKFANVFRRKHKYGGFSDFWAVNDISLEIKEGDRVGIIGHNGAGKSTFLKTLCRVYEPTKGQIVTEGRIAPLLEIGAGFHPEFTGRENIYLNGAILGYTKDELLKLEQEIIDFAELAEFIETPVKYYSTGMYMRMAFSLATAISPEIIILDEIFAGGDAAFVQKAKKRMHDLIDSSDIMIMVSHDHQLVQSLCNRVIWIDHGKMVADGEPETVIDAYLQKSGQ